MKSKVKLNEYIVADIISDILSQNITRAKKMVETENTEESKEFLEKLLYYEKEAKKGNQKIIKKIIKGEI